MALVTVNEVQAWLESTKLRLGHDDELPEEVHLSRMVLSKLATRFDISAWVDETTTPDLVRTIIAMLVAAARYNKQYSESDSQAGNPYANKLEGLAYDMLEQLITGEMLLTDATDGPGVEGTVAFYPTDASSLLDTEDDSDRKFSMGQVF